MKLNILRKITNSVFIKLLMILILTGLCINMVVGIFFNHALKYSPQSPIQKYLNQYVDSIIEDLGIPPELKKAKEVARRSAPNETNPPTQPLQAGPPAGDATGPPEPCSGDNKTPRHPRWYPQGG